MSAERAVRHNVDRVLEVFQQVKKNHGHKVKRFRTWVDKTTGEIQIVPEGKSLQGKQWQEVRAVIAYDTHSGRVAFEEEAPAVLDFDPKALKIFQETIYALKQLETVAACRVQLADYLLINRIWKQADRFSAEEVLMACPIGTYLFRKDEFAHILEEKLQKEQGREISLWTVTVLQAHQKCSDYTLVHLKGKWWQVYNDDLSFGEACFASLGSLLGHYKQLFRYPLYRI